MDCAPMPDTTHGIFYNLRAASRKMCSRNGSVASVDIAFIGWMVLCILHNPYCWNFLAGQIKIVRS